MMLLKTLPPVWRPIAVLVVLIMLFLTMWLGLEL